MSRLISARLHARARDERGATLVLSALLMVGLLATAGLVLDYGLVRADRQRNKSASDFAVTAGLRGLDVGGIPRPFRGVCEAVNYLKANHNELGSLLGTWKTVGGAAVPGDPCTTGHSFHNQACSPSNRNTWAWYDGQTPDGRIEVDIKSGYVLGTTDPDRDTRFDNQETLVNGDVGTSNWEGCEHLAVFITEAETPGFGRLVHSGDLTSSIRSVGRVTIQNRTDVTVGLLLLEQHSCASLEVSGNNDARVIVHGFGQKPGIVHADSLGDDPSASGRCNSKQILSGGHDSPPGILAERAPLPAGSGAPGIISVTALGPYFGANPSKAVDPPSHVEAQGGTPQGNPVVSRIPVDLRYRQHVVDRKSLAQGYFNWSFPANPAPAPWVRMCPPNDSTVSATHVWVDCGGGGTFNSSNVTFDSNVQEIVFSNRVTVNSTLTFDNPREIYIKGANNGGLSGSGTLNINTRGAPSCAARSLPPYDRTESTVLVVGQKDFSFSGTVKLCQTFLYMMDGELYPFGAAPEDNTDKFPTYSQDFEGTISVGGGSTIDWTAPNETSAHLDVESTSDHLNYFSQFEDLAFFTESSRASSIAGSGGISMSGIFFLPNADPFVITGGAGQLIDADAQFITRKLSVQGHGTLDMKPNPDDSVDIPFFANIALVR